MTEKDEKTTNVSMSNTKKEMLDAYNNLVKQLQEKKEKELKPEIKKEEKKNKEIMKIANELSSEGVIKGIGSLKVEIGKLLTQISDKLEEEVTNYIKVKEAINIRQTDLQEIYEIEKEAETLTALLEIQAQKREEFETEMQIKKEDLDNEMQQAREEREKDRQQYEITAREQETTEKKLREREKEEYEYAFKREQQIEKDKFEDEKEKIEKEIQLNKEIEEKQLTEREEKIAEKEEELIDLRNKVNSCPKELELGINKAIKETPEKCKQEKKTDEELFKKIFEGERNVLVTKIESLEKKTEEQSAQISNLLEQLEKSYQKVESIAVKSTGGASDLKSLASLQQLITEQTKKQDQDK